MNAEVSICPTMSCRTFMCLRRSPGIGVWTYLSPVVEILDLALRKWLCVLTPYGKRWKVLSWWKCRSRKQADDHSKKRGDSLGSCFPSASVCLDLVLPFLQDITHVPLSPCLLNWFWMVYLSLAVWQGCFLISQIPMPNLCFVDISQTPLSL